MKVGRLIVVFGSLALIAAIMLAGCGAPASPSPSASSTPTGTPTAPPSGSPTAPPTPTPTPVAELSYNALSPRGIQPAIQVTALNPRFDTLDGKLIWVNQGEADPVIMPVLWERVQKDFPKANWKYIATSSFGPSSVEADVLLAADGVIRGISW